MALHQKPVRLGLDARSIFMPRPRGTGRNLSDAYAVLQKLRPQWEFYFYHQRSVQQSFHAWGPNARFRCVDIPGDRFDAWRQIRLPVAAWLDGLDLLHMPANAAPAFCPIPYVATIHDLIPLRPDERTPSQAAAAFKRGVLRAARGAVHIITPSQATADELSMQFHVEPDRITVIPWAPDRMIGGGADSQDASSVALWRGEIARVRNAYRLPESWLLNFSGASPRKNAVGLIEAFARVPAEKRADAVLVLVGCEPASFRKSLELLRDRLGLGEACRLCGFVPHEDLPGLLRGARGMLMPSLCEGFGLPILDAFACDVPVLTSNLSSMPEVAGRAAIYCDPHDPDSIAAGVVELLEKDRAEELRRAGKRRLKEFSWSRTADLMCDVFERCLAVVARRARSNVQACGGST